MQAENEVVGLELQKQLEAAGNILCNILEILHLHEVLTMVQLIKYITDVLHILLLSQNWN